MVYDSSWVEKKLVLAVNDNGIVPNQRVEKVKGVNTSIVSYFSLEEIVEHVYEKKSPNEISEPGSQSSGNIYL